MPTADVSFPFPKTCRLKSSLQIKDVVQQRHSVFCFPLKCFYLVQEPSDDPACKVAFLVSKRRFRHAVDRNRVKRLMREAFRLNQHAFKFGNGQSLLLCLMFVGDTLPTFAQMEEAVRRLSLDLRSSLKVAER